MLCQKCELPFLGLRVEIQEKPTDYPSPSNQSPFDRGAFGLKDFRDSPSESEKRLKVGG